MDMEARTVEELKAALEVVKWAQTVLSALNVCRIESDSPLHLKLREVMIEYRRRLEELESQS